MSHKCYNCSYCKRLKGAHYYCNDLDCVVDPDDPICSEENYYS